MDTTKKLFFRASEQEGWEWKRRASDRKMTVNDMMKEAAELYALIPPGKILQARAMLLDLKGDKAIRGRAVQCETPEEAAMCQEMLDLWRGGKEPQCAVLRALMATQGN